MPPSSGQRNREMSVSEFELAVKSAAEKAVLRLLAEGHWIAPDYANRFKIPAELLKDVWAMVDVEKIKARMAERLETELADRVLNHLAAEISTDVKQILSVKERREALRGIARDHFDAIMKTGLTP